MSGWLLVVGLIMTSAACTRPQPQPDLAQTATIKDIMDSMVDPSAEFLFGSVATISDENGITEKAPHTDEEWKEVRRRAIVLLEAPNLLVMNRRKVAKAGERSENPKVELQPEQIQALLDANRGRFIDGARLLQDAAAAALQAIDTKDKNALFSACERLDKACEGCHLYYWYPNDKRSQESFKDN